ncbi:MAG: AAA family ATPase [Pseudomonadota bacterium]|nr:AAA family ATPase [Pseudomonadota bacterium]
MRHPRTIAITGGKGGVGKTTVALNMALALASQGKRVLLMDADTDLANVSIFVGAYPSRTLADVIEARCELADIILETHFGLHIVPGASGVQACMELSSERSRRVLQGLHALEHRYDYVLIDTASGLQSVALHMIAATEMACVVVSPDPASLTDAFSLLKVLKRRGYRRVPSVVVNMAQGASQARSVFQRLNGASQRHLNWSLHYLGGLWRDETLRQSVINQRPVTLLPASDPSCRQFHSLVEMLTVQLGLLPARKHGIAAYWHKAIRQQPPAPETRPSETTEPVSPRDRCLAAVTELEAALAQTDGDAVLRYEAFARLFALLGRNPGADVVEILQTGLASMGWEHWSRDERATLAQHLRHFVGELLAAEASERPVPIKPVPTDEPLYDRIVFGEQEQLVRALREKPADVSLDELLRSLAGKGRSGP